MRDKRDTHTLDLFTQTPQPKKRKYVRKTEPRAMVRRTDPDTSRAAANSIDATALEQRVYEVICSFPNGCISDDIVRLIPEHGVQTVSPRYAKLIGKLTGPRLVDLIWHKPFSVHDWSHEATVAAVQESEPVSRQVHVQQ